MIVSHMQLAYNAQYQQGSEFIVANTYIASCSEADLMRVLKSGYTSEVEIKISVADFKNDFKKTAYLDTFALLGKKWEKGNKHEALAAGKMYCNRFYFFVPWWIVEKVEPLVPDHAGLLIFNFDGHIYEKKSAPLLHKRKLQDKEKYRIARNHIFKLWDLKGQPSDDMWEMTYWQLEDLLSAFVNTMWILGPAGTRPMYWKNYRRRS